MHWDGSKCWPAPRQAAVLTMVSRWSCVAQQGIRTMLRSSPGLALWLHGAQEAGERGWDTQWASWESHLPLFVASLFLLPYMSSLPLPTCHHPPGSRGAAAGSRASAACTCPTPSCSQPAAPGTCGSGSAPGGGRTAGHRGLSAGRQGGRSIQRSAGVRAAKRCTGIPLQVAVF